jgi:hypothetical protein
VKAIGMDELRSDADADAVVRRRWLYCDFLKEAGMKLKVYGDTATLWTALTCQPQAAADDSHGNRLLSPIFSCPVRNVSR